MRVEDDAARAGAGAAGIAQGADLFELLREDHRRILPLFDRIEGWGAGDIDPRLSLFHRIEEELQRHLEGEERFLYSALERREEARGMVLEGYELHRLMTHALGTFKTLALDDERWLPKVRVLRRLVEEHVRSQEQELFPLARTLLDAGESRAILEQFEGVRSGRDPRRGGLDAPQ